MRHKYNAKKTVIDDKKFPSKMEARYYQQLEDRKLSGEILFYIRQPPFDLPGGVIYRADFLAFFSDGHCEVIDVKGMDTPISKLKRKQVEDLYPIQIKVITQC